MADELGTDFDGEFSTLLFKRHLLLHLPRMLIVMQIT